MFCDKDVVSFLFTATFLNTIWKSGTCKHILSFVKEFFFANSWSVMEVVPTSKSRLLPPLPPFSSYLLAAPRVLLSWTSFLPKDTRDIDVKVQTARLLMLAYIRKPTMYIVLLELDSGEGDPSFSVHVIEVDLIMFLIFIRSTLSSFKDAFCETNHLATSK